jgi:hypothetical protein
MKLKKLMIVAILATAGTTAFGQTTWTTSGSNEYTPLSIQSSNRIYLPYSNGNNYIRPASSSNNTYFDGGGGVGVGHQGQWPGYRFMVMGKSNFHGDVGVNIGNVQPKGALDVNGTIFSTKGWGDWMQLHTNNGNGFWRIHNPQTQDYLVFGHEVGGNQTYALYLHDNGNVSIGSNAGTDPNYKLSVDGAMRAREIEVNLSTWADYVFEESYELMPLTEVEAFIDENQHLPNIPAANDMVETGLNVGDMQVKMMEKIEELTLYIIEQDKKINALEAVVLEKQ